MHLGATGARIWLIKSNEPHLLRENRDVYPSIYRREDHYTGLNWRVDLPVPFHLGHQTALLKDVLRHNPDPPWSRARWSFREGVARFEGEEQARAVSQALAARLSR